MIRESGILLPIFSLPSKYGIGCFSKEAYKFIDFLEKTGQSYWQILPLGPTGYGDSPYQSFSTFAGNPYFIDLEELISEELLTREECARIDFGTNEEHIDYEKIYFARFKILRLAFQRFVEDDDFHLFSEENDWWLADYSLYMAIKNKHNGISWHQWPNALKNRESKALKKASEELAEEVSFYDFLQFVFYKQWNALHNYARKRRINIIGDIPIYVAFDSADSWANPELFQFDEGNNPIAVAGVPPDLFSDTGQLWGNPLYDWEYHKQTDYAWWFNRIKHTFSLYDVVRIDHFRGFDEYYAVPAGAKDATNGSWEAGPGIDFFKELATKLGDLPIIAEDLGLLTPSVLQLLEDTKFPGMKVLQFAFDSRASDTYLPHTYQRNCVVYTGTHDNDTTRGWYKKAPRNTRKFAKEYLHMFDLNQSRISWHFIKAAMASVADLCIIPLQDYLCLGGEARINMPSTVGDNWTWRLHRKKINTRVAKEIIATTKLYGRYKGR